MENSAFAISQLQATGAENGDNRGYRQKDLQYEIIWVISGVDNNLYFAKPNQAHPVPANECGYIVSFTDAFLDIDDPRSETTYYNNLFTLFASARGIKVQGDIFPDLLDITEKMIKEFNNSNLFRMEILRRYFKIFLLYLTRALEGNFQIVQQSRNLELVQHFLSLLDRKFKTHKMVADYARELVVTPNYLNEVTKKVTGYSAGYHIRLRIVLEAKRLGTYTDSVMKEIAYDLGFSDSSHFSKFFKTVTGMNFSDFKKSNLIVVPAS